MLIDGIDLAPGSSEPENVNVEDGATLPTDVPAGTEPGRLFYLTDQDGSHAPGLYVWNGTEFAQ